ncbi:MAG: oxygen-independent coproporphyrinogen III oxidase [Gammaproteobacteria bacterium]|nr:oxygen-independent coproporphyrinogen III oxidase [Gammaproteobacteria bacterium]
MNQSLIFDEALIKRYDKAGPRYTSYPTAVQFNESFTGENYKTFCEKSNALSRAASAPTPLSLYFHIPFCDTVCFYCGCNKVVTKDRTKAAPYLARVHKEIAMQAAMFDDNRIVDQLHWGGGTPTFISHDEMRELMDVTRKHFTLHDDDSGEYSIELDPREVDTSSIQLLRELGFNRISLGVQDFDPKVQKAVNRIQSEEETLNVINAARENNFKSISLDLIYGLPFQNVERFSVTLDKIIEASPDRLSVFNYAHLPEMFKPQRRINEDDLPTAAEKLDILKMSFSKLKDAGYVYIGMDHFAKPDDELAIAQREGTLYRNFQGYSTHADCDLVAMGITSIGQVANSYSQNVKKMDEYFELIDAGKLPVYRGVELSDDDLLRREVITQLISHFHLDFSKIEKQFNINFSSYFELEQKALSEMHHDGLIELSDTGITVQPKGRLLIRNICMVFDFYLRQASEQRFSKVI